ncbi:MAG: ion transporter [Marinifilaceae bacterium]
MMIDVKKQAIWEIFIMLLSLYVIAELSIEIISPFSYATQVILDWVDLGICMIFLLDFFYFLYYSDNKKQYFKRRWIDLLSSIPFGGILRAFRVARVLRFLKFIKLLRGVKGVLPIIRWLTANKLRSVLISYIAILIVLVFYASLAFYSIEKDANQNVNEFFDSIWWSFITLTSVGYGDIFPVTKAGKIIAMILTISGMGLFSLITAELSAKFLHYINTNKK